MITILLTAVASFALAILLTPQVRRVARRHGILDRPDSDRKLHSRPTPLCGGVAVFLATVLTVLGVLAVRTAVGSIVLESARDMVPLLIAAVVILLLGLVDDITHLRGRQKLAGQIVAAAVIVGWGLVVKRITVFGLDIELGLLAVPFTILWLVGAINALNLLDGADGFATTIGLVISVALALIAVHLGLWFEAVVACAMAGALLGFLVFNLPPSSIFLGDSGSMLIGLVLGTLAIYGNIKTATTVALAAPIALLAVPILDSAAAVLRRTLTGRGLAVGDRAHLHHAMTRRGFGPRRLVVAAGLLSLITASGAVATVMTGDSAYAWGSVALLLIILVGSRLFGHNELRLVASRAVAFTESLLPQTKKTLPAQRQRKVGLLDSDHCRDLWRALTKFAAEHHLSRVRLDLYGSWMDDGHDVLWEQIHPQAVVENWRTSLPVFARGRIFGKVEIAGAIHGSSGQHILAPLGELLDSLSPCVERLIDDAAHQGDALHTGLSHRVLFINRSYWPDCEATGQLLTELCEDLARTCDVAVLAGQPNHIAEQAEYRTSGVQRRNDVEIYRVRHTRWRKRSLFGKACNLLSFMLAAVWQSFFIPKHEVVVVETDPFLLAILGGMLKRWRRSRLIIYMQDVYPDVALAIGAVREGLATRVVRRMLLTAYDRADRIVVLGEDMRTRLIRNGVQADKICCIPNWIDTQTVYPIKVENDFRAVHGLDDKFVVMHSGNMGLTQQLDQFLDVAERLQERDDVVFLLVGDGATRSQLQLSARDRRLTNVRFLPYQSRDNLALSLSAADLHVVSMHPAITGCLVPSKLYGIMAAGTPVLAMVPPETDFHTLIERENVGFAVSPGDLDTMEACIVRCADGQVDLEAMGLRARELAEAEFDRRHSVAKFATLLEEVKNKGRKLAPNVGSPGPPHARGGRKQSHNELGGAREADGASLPVASLLQRLDIDFERLKKEP